MVVAQDAGLRITCPVMPLSVRTVALTGNLRLRRGSGAVGCVQNLERRALGTLGDCAHDQ